VLARHDAPRARCSKFEHSPQSFETNEANPLAGALVGVKRPDRSAVDPSRTFFFCSVTVSCGRETIDLRRGASSVT